MGTCGLTLDPTAVQSALDACMAVLRQPDSAANFLRGTFVVSVAGVFLIGFLAGLRAVR